MDIEFVLLQLSLAQQALSQALYLAISANDCPDSEGMCSSVLASLDSCIRKCDDVFNHLKDVRINVINKEKN